MWKNTLSWPQLASRAVITDKLNENQAKIIAVSFRLLTVINDFILTNSHQLVKVKELSQHFVLNLSKSYYKEEK